MMAINQDKKIEMFMADIDGTLVNKGEVPLAKTKDMLRKLHERNILLGLASGRPIDNRLINKFQEWGLDFTVDFVIGSNGCEIYSNRDKSFIQYDLLPKEEVKNILDYMWDLNVNAIIFEDAYNHVLAKREDPQLMASIARNKSHVEFVPIERFYVHDVCKLEFHYDEIDEKEIFAVINKHATDNYQMIKTFTGTIEFQKPGVSKGKALEKVCHDYHIDIANVIGCGDMDNDVSLIEKAGIGICLLNGCDNAKKVADYITELDVEHDGVGDFFDKYFLWD